MQELPDFKKANDPLVATPELVGALEQSLQTAVKSFLAEPQSESQTRKGERGQGREEHL